MGPHEIAWQCASVLLTYPDEQQHADLPLVRRAAEALPTPLGTPLLRAVDRLSGRSLDRLQERYVETFDSRRRTNLFLTYFAHGDTRKRGVALLRFKQTYLRSGFVLDESELPDHLCVVLEYAATVDQEVGRQLLLDHRAGLEMLRLGLVEEAQPVGRGRRGGLRHPATAARRRDGSDQEAGSRGAAGRGGRPDAVRNPPVRRGPARTHRGSADADRARSVRWTSSSG